MAHQIHLYRFVYNEFDETDEVLCNLGFAQYEGKIGFAQLQRYPKTALHTSSVSFICSHEHFRIS